MNVFCVRITLYTLVICKYLPVLQKDERQRWVEFCHDDYTSCPNCFEENSSRHGCDTFLDNVSLDTDIEMEISKLFGNRKMQYGEYDQQAVVLKYLVSDGNLDNLKSRCCNGVSDCENLWTNKSSTEMLKTELLRVFEMKESVAGFQICPTNSVTRFMDVFSQQSIYEWSLLNINVEPLLVNTLRSRNFMVPTLHGLCGFVTIQSNNGLPLFTFYDQSFAVRLLIAKNLLSSALQFSYGVEGFR